TVHGRLSTVNSLMQLLTAAAYCFAISFAHASFKVTVRLNISFPGVESLSVQKYPSRRNWNLSPAFAETIPFSAFALDTTLSESGFRYSRNSPSSAFGFSTLNKRS